MSCLQVGLQVLLKDRHVFACHKDRWDTIYYSELGSSLAILQAGYNIDCLMLRYQGVDWRSKANWDCNSRYAVTPGHAVCLLPHPYMCATTACDGVGFLPRYLLIVLVSVTVAHA